MSLHIFNYSVKKLLNLEWSLSIIYSSWKNKTPRISSEILWMVINLSNNFLQNPLFFIVWNQKQILFILRKIGSRETKLLNFKRSSKSFPRIQKPYQVHISSVTLSHLLPFNPFMPADCRQQKLLGCSEFAEPNYLLTLHIYLSAYLGIMLPAPWHIPEGN